LTGEAHIFTHDVPVLLDSAMKRLKHRSALKIIDIGCGEGAVLMSLGWKGYLHNAERIVGVDLSEERTGVLRQYIPNAESIISDACNIPQLQDSSFDLIICSQLIEHLPSQKPLIREMKRLLRDDGLLYLSSVARRPTGFWIYDRNGEPRLSPEHIFEFPSIESMLDLVKDEGMIIEDAFAKPLRYPLIDMALRMLEYRRLMSSDKIRTFFLRNGLEGLRILRVPIPGYYWIETLARKKSRC